VTAIKTCLPLLGGVRFTAVISRNQNQPTRTSLLNQHNSKKVFHSRHIKMIDLMLTRVEQGCCLLAKTKLPNFSTLTKKKIEGFFPKRRAWIVGFFFKDY